MKVLVHEPGRRSVDRPIDVERDLEKPTLERSAGIAVAARDFLRPTFGLVCHQGEGVFGADLDLQALQQVRHDADLVDTGIPEWRPRHAALEQ